MSVALKKLAWWGFCELPQETQTLAKALVARGAVEEPELLPSGYVAIRVRGGDSYVVQGNLRRELVCTCSWRRRCKHIGAVLFTIGDPGTSAPVEVREAWPFPVAEIERAARDAVDDWLASVAASSKADAYEMRIVFVLERAGAQLARQVWLGKQHRVGETWSFVMALPTADLPRLREGRWRGGVPGAVWSADWDAAGRCLLAGKRGAFSFEALVASGFLRLRRRSPDSNDHVVLYPGPERSAKLAWARDADGELATSVELGAEGLIVVPTDPAHYIDPGSGLAGRLSVDGDVSSWLAAPPIPEERAKALLPELARRGLPVPKLKRRTELKVDPTPRLVLRDDRLPSHDAVGPMGSLEFRYAEILVPYGTPPFLRAEYETDDEFVQVVREHGAERAATGALGDAGLYHMYENHWLPRGRDWVEFLLERVPQLRAKGFEVEVEASFSVIVIEADDYFAELEPSDNEWFALEYGIEVAGERVDLLPLLLDALRTRGTPDEGRPLALLLPSGNYTSIPYARLEPLLSVLIELSHAEGSSPPRLNRWQAIDLADSLRLESQTARALRDLRSTLTREAVLQRPKLPKRFKATLRDYQWQGLAWLSALGKSGVGCVLADDMGLGKTVQLLAHIAARKQGRLSKGPSLVVMPTSVLLAWAEQIAQFAPYLRVVKWHGSERHADIEEIEGADVVLTTYALLSRDIETLQPVAWDLVILDEAQAIKNPRAIAGNAARRLQAEQRIAVTGTPLENHLGEVWSIFTFAAPGVLGRDDVFRKVFRNPIEKGQDTERMAALRRRVAPLLLRRTKEEVASDLPPKTIITQHVELTGAQRDVYETVRKLMDRRVRDEIARRGVARSQIVMLDALLKLRQVCCDPELLKLDKPLKKAGSAKRVAFMELLETLLAEGRRVLVFSQFVEMLDRLGADLKRANISFSRLTGSTRDRAAEIDRFMSGDVPVFLISLKAGGVGLNLTAADTVIHYDPWWNPATEAQATDRAHRIGQTKPVFVHRLIARGTVEEKIVALQARKAELASALLQGGGGSLKFDEALIAELFAPLV